MNALGFLRDPKRTTVMRLKGRVARVITHPWVGRTFRATGRGFIRTHGLRIDTRSDEVSDRTRAMMRLGIYEGAEVRMVRRHLRPTPTVIDLGASLGVLSCVAAQTLAPGARIVAVEANPGLLDCLRGNLTEFAATVDHIVEHGAVDYQHAPGAEVLFDRGIDHAGAARTEDGGASQFAAPAVRLGDLLRKHAIGEYTLLCDIEGAEVDVLLEDPGALDGCTEMVIELHDSVSKRGVSYRPAALAAIIRDLGYIEVASYGSAYVFRRPTEAQGQPSYAVVTTTSAELTHLADGLASRHRLASYGHSIITRERVAATRLVPRRLRSRLTGRTAPPHVPPTRQHSMAPVVETVRVALPRALARQADSLAYTRAIRMSQVAPGLAGDILVASHAAAREAFTHGTHDLRVLNMPSVHPVYRERTLREECERFPELASTMIGNLVPAAQLDRLSEEFELADVILVGSNFAAGTLIAEGVDPTKVVVSPYGVVSAVTSPSPRPDDGDFRVLYAGRLTQAKGLAYLLESYRAAADQSWGLEVIGRPQGDVTGFPGIGDWWTPSAPVPRSQMSRVFASADVLVLPTLFEGLPLTVLEAMSSGLPVIVTATGADEVVTDGVEGFVVPIRDSIAIADRLTQLSGDAALRRKMGAAAATRARDYSWDAYVGRTVAALDGAWRSRQPRTPSR